MIHPTAIIEEGARIAPDVEIGAYAIIGAHVELSAGVRIATHAVILGHTTLAEQVRVWPHATLGCEPQHLGFDGARTFLRIGPRTQIRENVTVHCAFKEGESTIIGADCMLMNGSHVAHDSKLGNEVTIAGGAQVAGHVEVGDHVFIAGNARIHQFSFIGRLAMIGGLRRVPRDVPPFVTVNSDDAVDGVNAVGLRRTGVSKEARNELVRLVGALRSANDPSAVILERADPQSEEAREFVHELQHPRRRGWMSFAPRGR